MLDRWTTQGFADALQQWASTGKDLAARLYTARLIGAEPDLILHGGGNVSVKSTANDIFGERRDVVHVKASGGDMRLLEPRHLPPLWLGPLQELRALPALDDPAMVNQVRLQLLDANAPTPSIETLLHAFLPHKFVDHSHADCVLALTNQSTGDSLVRRALGDRVAYVPYFRPGFDLAKAVADAVEKNPQAQGVVLLFHGLITFADDARTSYRNHIALCTACEEFLQEHSAGRRLTISFSSSEPPEKLAALVAPTLRGALAEPTGNQDRPACPPILAWRGSPEVLNFANSNEAKQLCEVGALTGDHVMHTRPWPLLVHGLDSSDAELVAQHIRNSVAQFREKYAAYLRRHGADPASRPLSPRVVVLPGAGLFACGPTKSAASVSADIAEHTIRTKTLAHLAGAYAALGEEHLFDMEFRTIQRAKLGPAHDLPLADRIVAVSGAAGAIGAGIAESCARAGAHLVLTDIDEGRLCKLEQLINDKFGTGRAAAIPMDVTDEESVRDGFDAMARVYGGVDTLVPNAGIAHVAAIENLEISDFRKVMDVNAIGYFLFMRAGIRMLKQQAIGGQIVVIGSKNVFAPGKDFAAYSASKAAASQLGKVAAIELAPLGIRVNMISPDAVFGDASLPSGLWESIGPDRARSRNIEIEALPHFYRQRNLLKTPVHPHHVGEAVVFFASARTPTTGATLPVDGGVTEAFPR